MQKIALVTGANRGIGLEICRQLIQEGFYVIATSRKEKSGPEILKHIGGDKNNSVFFTLDVNDSNSIKNSVDFVQSRFGKLDVLINNAGILIDGNSSAIDVGMEVIRKTFETNLIGPFQLIQAFIPLMKQNGFGRIINLSSGMGAFNEMSGGYAGYRISKTALNALTKIIASELSGTNILVNTMCPGWVRTDMGGPNANRSVEQGADTAVWLAKLPDNGPNGKFFRDRKEIAW